MYTRPVCYAFLVVAALLFVEATYGTDAHTIPPLGRELAADERSGFSCGTFESVASSTAEWLRCVLHKRDWDVVLSTYLSVAICRRRHGTEATADALASCRQKPIGQLQLLALVMNNTQVVPSRVARKDGSQSQNANPSEELMQRDQQMSASSERSARGPKAAVIVRIERQKASKQKEAENGEQQSMNRSGRRSKRIGNPKRNPDNLAGQGVKTRAPSIRKPSNHRSRSKQGRRSTTPFIIATTTTTPVLTTTEEQNKHGDWDSEGDRGRSRYVHTPPPLTQQPYEEDDILDPLINVDHIQQCNADERARCGNGADSCSKVNGDIKCQCRQHFYGNYCENERDHNIENPQGCSIVCQAGTCIRSMPSRIDACRCFPPYDGTLCREVSIQPMYEMAEYYSSSASESASEEKLARLTDAVERVVNGTANLVARNLTGTTSDLPAATRETPSQSDAQTAARPAERMLLPGAESGAAALEERRAPAVAAEESAGDERLGG